MFRIQNRIRNFFESVLSLSLVDLIQIGISLALWIIFSLGSYLKREIPAWNLASGMQNALPTPDTATTVNPSSVLPFLTVTSFQHQLPWIWIQNICKERQHKHHYCNFSRAFYLLRYTIKKKNGTIKFLTIHNVDIYDGDLAEEFEKTSATHIVSNNGVRRWKIICPLLLFVVKYKASKSRFRFYKFL